VKILVSWLRDFVDVPVPVKDLAWDLNLCGFEVASVTPASPGFGVAGPDAEDAVIDFEITANRPDCLSVLGMAREVATRYRVPLRAPAPSPLRGREDALEGLLVTIEDAQRCPRYTAAIADVRIGPSPAWLASRLEAAGVRPINNVVDITNYVLMETGHPLHAFDLARLGGAELRIRCARPGERMTTLDGQNRALDPEMLVIADATRPQAIGGVMGGAESEVWSGTRTIAIESAYFLPASIRRTSKRLGLSTEASYRFERGADIEAPLRALARTCELIEQTGTGTVRPHWVDAYPGRRPSPVLTLSVGAVSAFLGYAVAAADVDRILGGLGFVVEAIDEDERRVVVPAWRGDVARDVDLYEEIARHNGYHRLPMTFPALVAAPERPVERLEIERAAKRLAAGAGFSEAVTFTFIERAAAEPFAGREELVSIANPLSESFAVLRPSLLPGLADALAHNRRRERRDVQLYETGTRFRAGAGETHAIGLAWLGAGTGEHWSGTGRPVDFFDIKGAVEAVCGGLGLRVAGVSRAERPWLISGRAAVMHVAGREAPIEAAVLGQLHPAVAEAHGLPASEPVLLAEIDLDAVAPAVGLGDAVTCRPLPRHPSVVRDISVLIEASLPAAGLRDTIRAAAPSTLVDLSEFARYQGRGVPDGQVSLSFRLTFRAADRTLTDSEVQHAVEAILAALAGSHGARLR
jgi:phenylalanyl-tRNA synthetase beta chain